jgi:hypothetical protein
LDSTKHTIPSGSNIAFDDKKKKIEILSHLTIDKKIIKVEASAQIRYQYSEDVVI